MGRTRSGVLSTFKKGGRGAEIGVFKGRFSIDILKQRRPETLYLIDPWLNIDDDSLGESWYGSDSKHDMNAHYEGITSRFAKQIEAGQVVVLRGTAAEMMPQIPDESLDYVYIDGDHRYEGVSVDLALAYTKVKPGGVIAVDDHVLKRWWKDGVVRAINEFLGRHADDLSIIGCEEGQVIVRRHPAEVRQTLIAAE
ncbi:class I SAM-dependent methyltransferase [Alphaproteobacteria bacterium KMM 3653]|uniref:Class I SAM-dependent methyltransferase n=1 Tax=Harenicola maris TaxID=2841044 RepID=A0AAP2CNJ4_9RHOB|nr:class I SAM-dependent methyltransferase [Harenicola maris]